jgi:tetratricopeptide (TPR) repeat protein
MKSREIGTVQGFAPSVAPTGSSRTLASLVLLLIGLTGSVHADQWNESYEKGLAALRERQYRTAVTLFTDAVEQKPESKANARTYGVRFIDYFPYVYRGVAHAHLGETSLALADFQEEDRIGEVYAGKQDTRAGVLLRERLEAFRKFAADKMTHADSAGRQASGPTSKPGMTQASAPGPKQTDSGSDTDTLFNRAAGEFARGNIMSAKSMFLEVRKRYARYPGVDDYLKKIRGTEQEVKKGIIAFFKGWYRQAVEALEPATRGGIDHPNAHAILGCSHAALYLLSGRNDHDQREKAEQEFRRVNQLDPRYDLNKILISPAIRELYASTVSH